MERKRVIIIGAAGRDFHDFNMLFRDNKEYEVVAFTAAQIPYISNRSYPKQLSGKFYPKGIEIFDEANLQALIKKFKIDICIQAYSDINYQNVMRKASAVNANGADFWLIAPERTMIKSSKPVIAVCAVRTGSGKSQTTRYIANILKQLGLRAGIIRHPMPYGVLENQIAQRFELLSDLDKNKCTVEEKEEYEQHIRNGFIVYAGVDYQKILEIAEKESDVIIWDGGNNDAPFLKPDLLIVVADPLRAGNEITYYPGETVARMADVLLVNKINSATIGEVERVLKDLKEINKDAEIILADSDVKVSNPKNIQIKGRRALVIEDGPTITHGGMKFGAGTVIAKRYNTVIVDARKYAIGEIKKTFIKYPHISELPAMGYSKKQIGDLEKTIENCECDIIISATPIKLSNILKIKKPIVDVTYDLKPKGPEFDSIIKNFVKAHNNEK